MAEHLDYTVRPLAQPVPITGVDPYFTAKWSDTRLLLAKEARHLGTARIIIELDVRERHIRNDGQLRADARPQSHGLAVVLLGTDAGDLRLQAHLGAPPSSTYTNRGPAHWHSNVRAVALSLEHLRAVSRYGTTPSSEQYAGFRQLEAGGPDLDRGAEIVAHLGGDLRAALRATHPDTRDPHFYGDADYAAVLAFKESSR